MSVFGEPPAGLARRYPINFAAEFWPPVEGPYAEFINPIPKYVVSRTHLGGLRQV